MARAKSSMRTDDFDTVFPSRSYRHEARSREDDEASEFPKSLRSGCRCIKPTLKTQVPKVDEASVYRPGCRRDGRLSVCAVGGAKHRRCVIAPRQVADPAVKRLRQGTVRCRRALTHAGQESISGKPNHLRVESRLVQEVQEHRAVTYFRRFGDGLHGCVLVTRSSEHRQGRFENPPPCLELTVALRHEPDRRPSGRESRQPQPSNGTRLPVLKRERFGAWS